MGCLNSKEEQIPRVNGRMSGFSAKPTTSAKEEMIQLQLGRGGRRNVIAQAGLDEEFIAPRYSKPEEYNKVIETVLKSPDAFFFTGIGPVETDIIVNAMRVIEVPGGESIIKKGDPGDNFYIVVKGSFSAIIDGKKVAEYGPKQFFGELALMYNKPRAASVTCTTDGAVLALEAKVFRYVMAHSSRSRWYEIFSALKKVHLLWDEKDEANSNLNEHQLARIAEVVEVVPYKKGETIIKKGEIGQIFYMIKQGKVRVESLSATSQVNLGNAILEVGAYFGEQALKNDSPRGATVVAETDTVLLCLDRESFHAILGPLEKIIDHNAVMRYLDTVPVFQQGLSRKERELVHESFDVEYVKAGKSIVEEGDVGDKFYIIKEGACEVITSAKGKTGQLVKGEHFGASALLESAKRLATVVATTDCELLSIGSEQFQKLVSVDAVKKSLKEAHENLKNENKNKVTPHATNYQFSDLREVAILGSGTFGRVSLVQHKKNKSVYALKAMLKSEIVAHKQQENVVQEKNVMIVSSHPFILKLYQTFKDQYKLYMLLEFVQGGELFSVLHPAHPPSGRDGVSDSAAKFYAAGVFLGIAYLHNDCNVAYRDMKPENCLVDEKGYPKLVDFGFAKVITSKSYTLCGTPEYLAPELVLGRGHNKSVDYWALGIMIYEMQSGYSPFSDPNGMDQVVICKNIVKGNLKFESGFNSDCKDLVKRLLNRDVHARLGNLRGGTDDIKNHKWFQNYDWNAYTAKTIKAPMVPKINSPLDTAHFDPYQTDDHIEDRSYRDKTNWAKDF